MATIDSPADMVNLALRRIGYKKSVGNLYDGSEAAAQALDIYGQTRDELLRELNPDCAKRDANLTLLKQAPDGGYIPPTYWSNTYPPLPWMFEYAYPADCIKARAVKPTPLFLSDFDPQYNNFSVSNDNSLNPPQKVILCNVPMAILVYTGRVTDPSLWEAEFIEAFAAMLGRRLAPVLVGMDGAKMEASDEQAETTIDDMQQG